MTEQTEWTEMDAALAQAQINFTIFVKKTRDDAFHAGFQAGTQDGLRVVMPAAARAMRESADMWPNVPKELVLAFADLMETTMTAHLAAMIPNAADEGAEHEQKQA